MMHILALDSSRFLVDEKEKTYGRHPTRSAISSPFAAVLVRFNTGIFCQAPICHFHTGIIEALIVGRRLA